MNHQNLKLEKSKQENITIQPTTGLNSQQIKALMRPDLDNILSEAKNAIDKQIQIDKIALITIFGIFASITSFLTIEFQFLRTLANLNQILGFTLILCSLLLGFNLTLDYLVKSRLDKNTIKPNVYLCGLIIVLFICGIYFMNKGLIK